MDTSFENEIVGIAKAAISGDKIGAERLVSKLARNVRRTGNDLLATELLNTVSQREFSLQKAMPAKSSAMKANIKDLDAFVLPTDLESRSNLADISTPNSDFKAPVLNDQLESRVSEFIEFVQNADLLEQRGLTISPSMLLYGPPGCGKTLVAHYIASELDLPLLTARSDTLVSSYLGSTSKNIRNLFEYASSMPCVLFLDEFDALAKARDDHYELGELKRVVVALLQNIDTLPKETVLIAASNHDSLLDVAVWRRFAYRLEVALPDFSARLRLLETLLKNFIDEEALYEDLALVSEGLSCAIIEEACKTSLRYSIIHSGKNLNIKRIFVDRLLENKGLLATSDSDTDLIKYLRKLNSKHFTMRKIADLLDISHSKVSRISKD